jgi:hypothetical protein
VAAVPKIGGVQLGSGEAGKTVVTSKRWRPFPEMT